jgi:hypothetical protein
MFKSYNRCYDAGRARAVGRLVRILGSTIFTIFALVFYERSLANLDSEAS